MGQGSGHGRARIVRGALTGALATLLVLGGGVLPAEAARAPRFVDAAVSPKAADGRLPIARPAGTRAGDVMIAGVAEHEVGRATAPRGWTLIRHDRVSGDIWLWVYYRVAGSSEPSRYVWRVGDKAANGAILTYRGVSRSDPVVDSAGRADRGTRNEIRVPSLDVGSTSSTRLVMFAAVEGPTPNPITPPRGFTERTERAVHPSTESSDMAFSGQGETGARSARPKVGRVGNVGAIVALRPA